MSLPELQPKAEVRPRLARGGEWKAFVPQTPTGRLCKINPVSRSLGIPINSPILFHFWPASTFAVKFHHQVGKCKLDFDANAALPVQKHPAENITFNQTGVPKFHLFTWIFSGKILIPADFFRSRMLWGLTIELLCGRRWAPRTFCWTGISECSGSEGSGSEYWIPRGSQSEDVMLDVPEEGAIEGLQGSWYIPSHIYASSCTVFAAPCSFLLAVRYDLTRLGVPSHLFAACFAGSLQNWGGAPLALNSRLSIAHDAARYPLATRENLVSRGTLCWE